jgi:TonB family protein
MFATLDAFIDLPIRRLFLLSMGFRSRFSLLLLFTILFPISGAADESDAGYDPQRLGRAIVYPVDAVLDGREGSVLMRVLVQPDGSASKIEWRQGDDTVLASAAFRAIINYRFSTPGRDSRRGEGWVYIPVRFSFEAREPAVDTAGRQIVGVVPAIKTQRGAPVPGAQGLRLAVRSTSARKDTVPPTVSMGALRRNLYYPDMARFNRFEGTVLVHVLVDQKGTVGSAYAILSDNEIFDAAALEAVRKTRFTPGRVAGRAAPLWTVIPIVFRLGDR